MAKIHRISILDQVEDIEVGAFSLSAYVSSFWSSEWGQIYRSIPWSELVECFDLHEKPKGREAYFSPQGKLALLFLKHYLSCSDERLIGHLNGHLHYQLFCGVLIDPRDPLKHRQLISTIRGELAHRLSIDQVQFLLAQHWKPYLQASGNLLVDATCYESEVRYPTDVKLLFESVDWLYGKLREISRFLGLRMARTKYKKWALRYGSYSRQRKPRVKRQKQIKRGLLALLGKLLGLIKSIEQNAPDLIGLKDLNRIEIIERVYEQQYGWFFQGTKPKGRIVSLSKSYLRPIVRGKENKPVEFGAKVNKIQLDGINFIEHLNFEAFHEGIRLQASIFMARKLVGKISRVAADRIYATNDNRTYCSTNNLFTDFIPKGRRGKFEAQKKLLRKALTKERASRLEGSFGNEKNAYYLRKVRARTKENEILWIFFGIHAANAREIGRRMAKQTRQKAA